MWRCLVLLIAISCGEPQRTPTQQVAPATPAAPTTQWWCIDKLRVCQASRAACDKIVALVHSKLPEKRMACVAQPKAWCKQSCLTDGPACAWQCAVDAAECEKPLSKDQQLVAGCRERTPPKHPDAFPNYFEPGWWCSEVRRDDGFIFSNCSKPQRECEGQLDLILMQRGLTRTTVPGVEGRLECKQAGRVWCSTMKNETELVDTTKFNCARTVALCSKALEEMKAASTDGVLSAGPMKFKLSDRCEEWTYD